MKSKPRACELKISYASRKSAGGQVRKVVYIHNAMPPVTPPEIEVMLAYLGDLASLDLSDPNIIPVPKPNNDTLPSMKISEKS